LLECVGQATCEYVHELASKQQRENGTAVVLRLVVPYAAGAEALSPGRCPAVVLEVRPSAVSLIAAIIPENAVGEFEV
jgi:hypothetical protein